MQSSVSVLCSVTPATHIFFFYCAIVFDTASVLFELYRYMIYIYVVNEKMVSIRLDGFE